MPTASATTPTSREVIPWTTPPRARSGLAEPGLRALPPYLVAGNRFGSYGFGAGLSGLLLALAPVGHVLAWFLVVAAVVLGLVGFVRYAQDGATNRDTSVVGLVMGWIGLLILLVEVLDRAQRAAGGVLVRTVNASRNRRRATSGSPDAQPSSPTTPV